MKQVTGKEAGLTEEDQIRIALRTASAMQGTANIQAIYEAVNQELRKLHQGETLSEQGRASLRRLVNTKAVQMGLFAKHNPLQPGWNITPSGLEYLQYYDASQEDTSEAAPISAPLTSNTTLSPFLFEQYILKLMTRMYPFYNWYHQGVHKKEERGLDLLGTRMDVSCMRIGVQVKLHQPLSTPSDAEWNKFLAGCYLRNVVRALFVTTGSLNGKQHREASQSMIHVLEGREQITRVALQYGITDFQHYPEEW